MNNCQLSYEEAVLQLEKILKELEEGNCSLEESLGKFKEGVTLYNYCNSLLTKAEGDIKILLEDDEGRVHEEEYPMGG